MRRSWLAIVVVLLCGVVISSRTIVHAQEAGGAGEPTAMEEADDGGGEEEAAAPKKVSVLKLVIQNSGIPGWIIILMSVVAIFLFARFLYYVRRTEMMPESLINQLEQQLEEGRVAEAVETCNMSDSELAQIVRAGLVEVEDGYEDMMETMEDAGEAESVRLHQQVGWLSIIGAVAPMLGLTGTVIGMMGAFATISQMEGRPEPAVLAENIQLALTTTCEGLIVAVPVLLAYAFFRNRVTSTMLEIGVVAGDLIGRFKDVEITPSMTAGVREAAQAASGGAAAGATVEETGSPAEEPAGGPSEAPPPPAEEEEEGDVPPPPPPA